LVENLCFNLPHLSLSPPLGVTPLEFRFGVRKLEGLSFRLV